uniref:Uncharacterized protein n=1 Tax=Oncorhynchus kisutch TaxID=8019 RepID=A0A8C7FPX5_ONCKI
MHCLGLGHTGYLFCVVFLAHLRLARLEAMRKRVGQAGVQAEDALPPSGVVRQRVVRRILKRKRCSAHRVGWQVVKHKAKCVYLTCLRFFFTCPKRMKYLENQQCETQAAKEEHTIVPTLTILCWLVYLVLHVEQLSIYCISLKKEVFASNIKLHKATMELNMTKDDMKAVQNDLTNADRDYLVIVQKTLSTLTHTNEALSRLVFESPAPVELKPPHLHQPPNSEDIALNMTFDIITPDPMYKRLSQVPSKKMHLDPAVYFTTSKEEVPMDTSFHNTNLFRKRTFGSMLDPKRIKLGAPICPLMKAKRGKKGSRPAPPKSSTCPTLNSFLE